MKAGGDVLKYNCGYLDVSRVGKMDSNPGLSFFHPLFMSSFLAEKILPFSEISRLKNLSLMMFCSIDGLYKPINFLSMT